LREFPDSIAVSARTGEGTPALLERIEQVLEAAMVPMCVAIPYQRGDLVDLFHKRGLVEHETHDGQGTNIEGKIPAPFVPKFREFA
jgi:GTP-binding protein HflX